MGKLHTVGKVTIRVYARDHRPAHFHVVAPDFEAMVAIETLDVLRGTMPERTRRAVMAWASANRATLVTEWNRINPDLSL